jgi:hypothetical protein
LPIRVLGSHAGNRKSKQKPHKPRTATSTIGSEAGSYALSEVDYDWNEPEQSRCVYDIPNGARQLMRPNSRSTRVIKLKYCVICRSPYHFRKRRLATSAPARAVQPV